MAEFWEESFKNYQAMWGFKPADAVKNTLKLFSEEGYSKILIPGFGYGRNAAPFLTHGFDVTGIEVSETAILLAKTHFGSQLKVYHNSVCDMPLDSDVYDGIFCYALIHLLDEAERATFINACYHQLREGGSMVFVAVSTNDAMYGEGEKIGNNRFKTRHGIKLFFYDEAAIEKEFGAMGFVDAIEINEPEQAITIKPSMKFWQIRCKKN